MEQIFSQLFYEVEKHRDTVLVTLIADRGSAPRKAGAQMLVGAEGRLVGTIGGGAVEGRSIQLSQQLLAQRRSCIREFPLHQAPERDIGMVCGGDVTAHFQFIPAEDPTWSETASRALALLNRRTAGWLVLAEDGSAPALLDRESVVSGSLPEDTAQALRTPGFSMAAGHISQALCPLLNTIGFRPVVFDDRPELANTRLFPTAEQVICGDFTRISDYLTITDEDFVVIMTSGHVRDFQVEEQTLRGDFAYVGVIGSRRKTASVNQRLLEAGIHQSSIDLVHTPIGTPILAVTPEEIAVSIAGEMIQVRAQRRGPTSHGCPMHS
jgi:xanthine dehydrogenase accessory factor